MKASATGMKSPQCSGLLGTPGFNLIEFLVVVGIMAIITAAIVPFMASYTGRDNVKSTVWAIVDTLRRAQSQTKAGFLASTWSVHFTSSQYVLFEGSSYNPSDPQDVPTSVTGTISISSISLNAGSSDVRFTNVRGETNDTGTIQVTDSSTGKVVTITISQLGLITTNL